MTKRTITIEFSASEEALPKTALYDIAEAISALVKRQTKDVVGRTLLCVDDGGTGYRQWIG